jgi:Family of unknown function (DUF6496)
MAKTTPRQRKTTGRVMHEFKHGELKSGRRGKGGGIVGSHRFLLSPSDSCNIQRSDRTSCSARRAKDMRADGLQFLPGEERNLGRVA